MSISVDQNLVAAIIQIYRRIYGQDPDEATVTFWLTEIESGRATLDTLQESMLQTQQVGTETAEVVEYKDSDDAKDSWAVASVGELGLGLGSGSGVAVGGAGGIAAAVGGIAAAAGGGGGGGGTTAGISTVFQQPDKAPTPTNTNPEITSVRTSGGGSQPMSGSSDTREPSPNNQSSAPAPQQDLLPNNPQSGNSAGSASAPAAPAAVQMEQTLVTDPVQLFAGGHEYWLGDMYFQDLNSDGVDEIIVAGRMSQPATEQTWLESNLFVLGWNTGQFAVENHIWFADSTDAVIVGTEPSVLFGDFDGDGRIDISVASGTDGVFADNGPNLIFFNDTDGLTRVEVPHVTTGIHGHAVADFNDDGLDDLFYLSWPQGGLVLSNAERQFDSAMAGTASGSSVIAGDFLGDGTVQVIITDFAHSPTSDTNLFRLALNTADDSFSLEHVSELPRERFYLAEWDDLDFVRAQGQEPHSVRSVAMDFDHDQLLDAVIITSANDSDGSWHRYTEVQFLKNLGDGSFSDVTSDYLVGFNNDTVPSYAPRLIDVNDDDVLDIWLGAQDYRGSEDSNRVLMSDADGNYVDSWAEILEQFRQDVGGNAAPVHFTESPDGDQYLLSMRWDIGVSNTFHIAPVQDYFIS